MGISYCQFILKLCICLFRETSSFFIPGSKASFYGKIIIISSLSLSLSFTHTHIHTHTIKHWSWCVCGVRIFSCWDHWGTTVSSEERLWDLKQRTPPIGTWKKAQWRSIPQGWDYKARTFRKPTALVVLLAACGPLQYTKIWPFPPLGEVNITKSLNILVPWKCYL